MNRITRAVTLALLGGLAAATAAGQESPAPAVPLAAPAQKGATPMDAGGGSGVSPKKGTAQAPAGGSGVSTKTGAAQIEAGEPRVSAKMGTAQFGETEPRAGTSSAAPNGATQHPTKPNDRVELDTTTVTGNRELPKVMYIVPWKKSDIGDPIGRPMNSLLDEVLAPVDREVFRREVTYYQAVNGEASRQAPPPPGAAKQGEK